MKILAIEVESPGATPEQFGPHLKPEAARVWDLYAAGVIREAYFDTSRHVAVLMLECVDVDAAQVALDSLPLVRAGLIRFDLYPLTAYTGFSRLFGE
jgi:hypothetical protein